MCLKITSKLFCLVLMIAVGCSSSNGASHNTELLPRNKTVNKKQASGHPDHFAVGCRIEDPRTLDLDYTDLVDTTVGRVSLAAFKKYNNRFDDYLQARRTSVRGKLFEAAVAFQANCFLEENGKLERVLTTAAEGDPGHPADNLLWLRGDITKSFQLKSTRNRKSITRFLTEKEYTAKYDDEIIVVHPETLHDIKEDIRRVALRSKSLSIDQQIVKTALEQGRLTDEVIPGLKVPSYDEMQEEADSVIARQFEHANSRFGTSATHSLASSRANITENEPHNRTSPENDSETVFITKSGKKYHRDGCQYLRKSKQPISLSEARKTHTPCKRCHPPK